MLLCGSTPVWGKLEKQLYPNRLVRWALWLKGLLWDKPRHLRIFNQQRAENIASLKDMMKKAGMGGLTGKLENSLDYESARQTISGMHLLADQGKLMVALQLEKEGAGVTVRLNTRWFGIRRISRHVVAVSR